jgi:hypothetical protein
MSAAGDRVERAILDPMKSKSSINLVAVETHGPVVVKCQNSAQCFNRRTLNLGQPVVVRFVGHGESRLSRIEIVGCCAENA